MSLRRGAAERDSGQLGVNLISASLAMKVSNTPFTGFICASNIIRTLDGQEQKYIGL